MKRRLLRWSAIAVVLAAAITATAWLTLVRLGPDPYASPHLPPEERYKYGSIGVEPTNGVPYRIWQVLPQVFADELPGGYAGLGFVWEPGRELPVGAPKRDVGIFARVGINCATCHVATYRISPGDAPTVVPGGPSARMDIQRYQRFLTTAAASPKFTADTLIPAMQAAGGLSFFEEMAYRFVLIPGAKAELAKARERNAWMDRNPDWGPGRIDPFNPVKFGNLQQAVDTTIGNSDMMPNWNLAPRDGHPLHWDGLNTSVREVILSSALGDGTPPEALDLASMAALQRYLSDLQPPPYPLPVDTARATLGRAVFQSRCSACHAPASERPPGLHPASAIGVDEHRLRMWEQKDADAYNQRYRDYPWRLQRFQNVDAYLAPPLDGLWLRAPYLHNGSVPTIADLLNPVSQRPRVFYRGSDILDPVRLGFEHTRDRDPATGLPNFRYDTSLPGNSNQGHEHGIDLSPDDKLALIEYLKTQ